MSNDAVTPLGKILRITGIDELPQLINIIKGDMTLVGPRPLTQADIERLEWQSDFYNQRWHVLPGITGLAQLSPRCHKKLSWFYDRYYNQHASLLLDYVILIQSACVPLVGKTRVKSWLAKKRA